MQRTEVSTYSLLPSAADITPGDMVYVRQNGHHYTSDGSSIVDLGIFSDVSLAYIAAEEFRAKKAETGGGGGGGGAVLVANLTITAAQLKALIANGGVELVAAQGANKAIAPIALFFAYVPNTTGFTVPGGTQFHFRHLGASNLDDWFGALNASAVQGGPGSSLFFCASLNDYDDVFDPVNNIPFYMTLSGATELTNGDGKVNISVTYVVVDLS